MRVARQMDQVVKGSHSWLQVPGRRQCERKLYKAKQGSEWSNSKKILMLGFRFNRRMDKGSND